MLNADIFELEFPGPITTIPEPSFKAYRGCFSKLEFTTVKYSFISGERREIEERG